MFTKTITGAAAAAAITIMALGSAATSAQAGSNWHFSVGVPSIGHGYHVANDQEHRNPCRHWKRKWRRTGRYYYLRRYRRCMTNHD